MTFSTNTDTQRTQATATNMAISYVLWNPHASGSERHSDLRRHLAGRGFQVVETDSREQTESLAEKYSNEGAKRIVAAGGDGSVNAVVNGLLRCERPAQLGILPLGTANDLCRTLYIDPDPWEAARLLEHDRVVPLDVLHVRCGDDAQFAINAATGGNSTRIRDFLSRERKQTWGPWAYVRGAVETLAHLESYRLKISIDGERTETIDSWNVIIANGRYAGGVEVAPHAEISDGLLDLIVIRDGEAADLASLTATYIFADYLSSPQVLYERCREVTIEAKPAIGLSLDGEYVGPGSIEVKLLPQALSVVPGDDY